MKIEALLCHRSQAESHHGDRTRPTTDATPSEGATFAAKVRRQLAEHGSLAGLASGEAFHLIAPESELGRLNRPLPELGPDARQGPVGPHCALGDGKTRRSGSSQALVPDTAGACAPSSSGQLALRAGALLGGRLRARFLVAASWRPALRCPLLRAGRFLVVRLAVPASSWPASWWPAS